MKTMSQLKMTSQMKVEGMLTIQFKILIAKIINKHFVFNTNNFGCLSDDSLIMSFYRGIKFADPPPFCTRSPPPPALIFDRFLLFGTCKMRLLKQTLNLRRIFDSFSRRFDKIYFI